jgi:hypothetical protein
MKGKALLEKYPLSSAKIKEWYLEQIKKSFREDIPNEFQQAVAEDIKDTNIGIMIDAQPRTLFDVFDDNDLYINVIYTPSVFMVSINQNDTGDRAKTRKEAELFAIIHAFEILENNLTLQVKE